MALYHKYRPQKFEDLEGQEHIKEILVNALKRDRVGHAYLFAGPRGLGKTTTARILAKALNCLKNEKTKHQPCNKCQLCSDISASRALDVIEIDAASNRGIDEIRELRDKVKFAPSIAAKKIYIIDEVHMLTKEAFNALLKTLEEPPAHVIFIMATTEPNKIPQTILSRVQRLDFRRPTEPELINYLAKVAKKEKINIDKPALEELAKLAQGSFRDGIVLLDQVMAGGKSKVDLDWILKTLGLASMKEVNGFIQAIEDQNLSRALQILDQLSRKGHDLKTFLDLTITQLRRELRHREAAPLVRYIEVFLKALAEIPFSPEPALPVELALYRLIKTPKPPKPPQTTIQDQNIHTAWQKIIKKVRQSNSSLASLLSGAVLEGLEGKNLNLVVKYKFYRDLIKKASNRQIVEKIALQILGQPISLKCRLDPDKVLKQEKKQDSQLAEEVNQILG